MSALAVWFGRLGLRADLRIPMHRNDLTPECGRYPPLTRSSWDRELLLDQQQLLFPGLQLNGQAFVQLLAGARLL
jgi:hypothetical protein